jgi:hypothetical protein
MQAPPRAHTASWQHHQHLPSLPAAAATAAASPWMPGSSVPRMSSRLAPPPVEMKLTGGTGCICLTADTLSPPVCVCACWLAGGQAVRQRCADGNAQCARTAPNHTSSQSELPHACACAPPITVVAPAAVALPMASATARVPAANPGTSNRPIGPFQNSVLQLRMAASKAAAVLGPMSSPKQPVGV